MGEITKGTSFCTTNGMISYVLYISVIESGDNANLVRNRKFLPETNTGGNYKHIFDNLLMHVYNLPINNINNINNINKT
jgi:hypothetical protein